MNSRIPLHIDQQLLEFQPQVICTAYQGFEVLQIQGLDSKEYWFGNYFKGKYCGYIYWGDKFTHKQSFVVCKEYMPPHLDLLDEYDEKYGHKIWYKKIDTAEYAWLCEKLLVKI